MTYRLNIDGTVSADFQIGKVGPTIYQGQVVPAGDAGENGDLFVRIGATPEIRVKAATNWLPLTHPSLGLMRWEIASGDTFEVPPIINYVGVAASASDDPTSIVLPPDSAAGTTIIVKDESGAAGDHPISITATGLLIDGGETCLIETDYGCVTLLFGGTQWAVKKRV